MDGVMTVVTATLAAILLNVKLDDSFLKSENNKLAILIGVLILGSALANGLDDIDSRVPGLCIYTCITLF